MKRIFRKFLIATATTAVFVACKPNESIENPLEDSQISFQGVSEGGELFGTVSLSAQLGEQIELDQVTFFVGDTEINRDTEAPFEFEWNTHTVNDGNYNLKLVAQKEEETKEVSLSVSVNNKLLLINTNFEGNPQETRKQFVFITDAEGKLVGEHVELTAGQQAEIRRPEGFEAETFNLHLFNGERVEAGKNPRWANINTYQDFTMGEITVGDWREQESDVAGIATVTLTNVPENFDWLSISGRPAFSFANSEDVNENNELVIELEFYSNEPATFLVSNYDVSGGNNTYLLTEEISINDQIMLDFNNFVATQDSEPFSTPAGLWYDITVFGYNNDSDHLYYYSYVDGYEAQSNLTLPLIPSIFSKYNTDIWVNSSEGIYEYQTKFSSSLETTHEPLNSELVESNYQNNTWNTTISGTDHDFYYLTFSAFDYSEENGERYFDWYINSDRTEQELALTELPAELKTEYSNLLNLEMEPSEVVFFDVEDWNDKEDMLDYTLRNTNTISMESEEAVERLTYENKVGYRSKSIDLTVSDEGTRAHKVMSKRHKTYSFKQRPVRK